MPQNSANREATDGNLAVRTRHNEPAPNLIGLTRAELEELANQLGEPRFRGGQLYHAIYNRRARDFVELTDLSRGFRQLLKAKYEIRYPEIERQFASYDGSVRYLLWAD